ncbi:MAG: hypothetical protein QOK40_18 [Miltoncostaeaceae bacterium]|jgi:hypothetical protein|nr:hypothetical protein [Miltoncostaeaceae bacterium]
MSDLDRLLDDFASRFARGERPDAGAYLARAGPDAEQLRELIDDFLVAVPPAPPDEESVALMEAWIGGEPPLLELRRRRGRRREAVVEAILVALGIDPARRARVAGHYHRLESGLLDLRGVDRRVVAAIAGAIGSTVEDLAMWAVGPTQPVAMDAYLRTRHAAPPAAAPAAARAREHDEVDRLFGVGG